jgi:hypothetical protein
VAYSPAPASDAALGASVPPDCWGVTVVEAGAGGDAVLVVLADVLLLLLLLLVVVDEDSPLLGS